MYYYIIIIYPIDLHNSTAAPLLSFEDLKLFIFFLWKTYAVYHSLDTIKSCNFVKFTFVDIITYHSTEHITASSNSCHVLAHVLLLLLNTFTLNI